MRRIPPVAPVTNPAPVAVSDQVSNTAAPAARDGIQPFVPPASVSLASLESPPEATGAPPRYADPIPCLMPHGSISTLSGAAGVGKTAFLSTFICDLQAGNPIFDMPTNPPPAIGLLVCDRPWRDHSMWFDKAGCSDLPHVSLRDIAGYQWEALRHAAKIPELFGALLDSLNLPPGALVIVDPLPLFVPGRLHDYKDVAIGMGHLDQQLSRRQLTMLGVCHVGKQKSNKNDRYMRPQDRILGSTALIGYSETAFYLLSPEEAEHQAYEFGAIPHQIAPLTLHYKRNELGLFVPANELDNLDQIEQAIRAFPPDDRVTTARALDAIMKTLTCGRRVAEYIIKRLLGDGRVVRVSKGVYRKAKPS